MSEETGNPFVQRLVLAQNDLRVFIASLLPFHDDDVADVLQETNLALVAVQDRYDSSRPFLPWALGFAKRQVLVYFQNTKRAHVLFSSDVIDALAEIYVDERSLADPTQDRKADLLARLRVCRERLRKKDAVLLQLFYDRGKQVKWIAHSLNRRENTVRVDLNRIRDRLGRCIQSLCSISDDAFERNHANALDEAIDDSIEGKRNPSDRLLRKAADCAKHMEKAELKVYLDRLIVHSLLSGNRPRAEAPSRPIGWPRVVAYAAGLILSLSGIAWAVSALQSSSPVQMPESSESAPVETVTTPPVVSVELAEPTNQALPVTRGVAALTKGTTMNKAKTLMTVAAATLAIAPGAQAETLTNLVAAETLERSEDVTLRGAAFPMGSLKMTGGTATFQAADSADSCTLAPPLSNNITLWLDANVNVVISNGTDVVQWLDRREIMPTDGSAMTNWLHPRAVTYVSPTGSTYTALAPKLLTGVADFPGKRVVDFGEAGSDEWLLLVAGTNATKTNVWVNSFHGVFGFGSTSGEILGDTGNLEGEGNGIPCYQPAGFGSGISIGYWIGGNDAPTFAMGETRLNGVLVNPCTTKYPYNAYSLLSQNGPFHYKDIPRAYEGLSFASTLFNDRNYKSSNGAVGLDRQGGGKIAEIILYDRVLTASERRAVEAYLAQKWFGTSALGSVNLASGAKLAMTNDSAVSATDVSGLGRVVKTGAGTFAVERNAGYFGGSLRLEGGAYALGQKAQLPAVEAVGGKRVTAEERKLSVATGSNSKVFEVSGATSAPARLASFDSSIEHLAVDSNTRVILQAPAKASEFGPFAGYTNPIANASFEQDFLNGGWGYSSTINIPGWKSDISTGRYGLDAGTGLWFSYAAPEGKQVLYIQDDSNTPTSQVSQVFSVPARGLYAVRLWVARRNYNVGSVAVHADIYLDGVKCLHEYISNFYEGFWYDPEKHVTSGLEARELEVTLPPMDAGIHTLKIMPSAEDEGAIDRALVVDNVRVIPLDEGEYVDVPNGGFDSSHYTVYHEWGDNTSFFVDNPPQASWNFVKANSFTYTNESGNAVTVSSSGIGAGITDFGTWWTRTKIHNATALADRRKAYLQGTGSISESVTFPRDGRIRFSMRYSKRSARETIYGEYPNGNSCKVFLDGKIVCTAFPTSQLQRVCYGVCDVKAGTATLSIHNIPASDASLDLTSIVDDIRIKYIDNDTGIVQDPDFNEALGDSWQTSGTVAPAFVDADDGRDVSLTQDAGIAQTVTILSNGVYAVTVTARGHMLDDDIPTADNACANYKYYAHTAEVTLDGLYVGSIKTETPETQSYVLRLPALTAGKHTLGIKGVAWDTELASSLIRKVTIDPMPVGEVSSAYDFSKATISLAADAKLSLDYFGSLKVDTVKFNGSVISGIISSNTYPALITGPGTIRSEAKGTVYRLE